MHNEQYLKYSGAHILLGHKTHTLGVLWGRCKEPSAFNYPNTELQPFSYDLPQKNCIQDVFIEQCQSEIHHITVLHIWVEKLAILPRKVLNKARETSNV